MVVGPGRSGTSAVTAALGALSADLGDRLKPALRKNARGFFEDLDLLKINYRLHRVLGLRPNGSSVGPIDHHRWQDSELSQLRQDAMRMIRHRFGGSDLWGFKCGGVLRVLPFWESILENLDLDICYVVAIRNPLSVAGSRAKLDIYREAQEKSDLEWLAQIVPYFHRVVARPFVVIDYDNLVGDPDRELRRIARLLQIDVLPDIERQIHAYAVDFLTADLRHNRATLDDLARSQGVNPLTREAYLLLLRLANDDIEPQAGDFRAGWQEIERSFIDMAPLLRHIDYLEDRLRRRGPTLKGLWLTAVQHLPVAATLTGVGLWPRTKPRQVVSDS